MEVRLHNQLHRADLQFSWRLFGFKSFLHLIWSVNSSLVNRVVLGMNLGAFALKSGRPVHVLSSARLRRGLVCKYGAREISIVQRLLCDVYGFNRLFLQDLLSHNVLVG